MYQKIVVQECQDMVTVVWETIPQTGTFSVVWVALKLLIKVRAALLDGAETLHIGWRHRVFTCSLESQRPLLVLLQLGSPPEILRSWQIQSWH